MGLTTRKEEQLKEMPIIKSSVGKSKDGKYIIQRTIITNIKPVVYYEAVLSGKGKQPEEEDFEEELKQYA